MKCWTWLASLLIVGTLIHAQAQEPVTVADPAAPREPGIYYYSEAGGAKQLTKLPLSSYDKTKSGFAFFGGYGQQTKTKAVIEGGHAAVQLADNHPIFYFHFAAVAAGLGENVAQTPDDYVLSKLELKNKERRLVVGKQGLYSGSKVGADKKKLAGFTVEKVGDATYKVTPEKNLADGEYCFFRPIAGQGTFFDFGIQTVAAAKK